MGDAPRGRADEHRVGPVRAQLLVEPARPAERAPRPSRRPSRAGGGDIRAAFRLHGRAVLAPPRRVHLDSPISNALLPGGAPGRPGRLPGGDRRAPLGASVRLGHGGAPREARGGRLVLSTQVDATSPAFQGPRSALSSMPKRPPSWAGNESTPGGDR